MKIVHTPPPNYKDSRKHFPKADFEKGVLFTYGDTCYCKSITPDLVVHEEVHTRQQINPKKWWKRYFKDEKFRFSQELEAYQAQWEWIKKNIKDRNLRFKVRDSIMRELSGELYGNIAFFSELEEFFKI